MVQIRTRKFASEIDWPLEIHMRLNIAGHPFNIGFKESLSGTPYLYKSRGKSSNNMIYLPMNKIMASLHYLVFCCYSSWVMKKNYFCLSRVQCNNMILGFIWLSYLSFRESSLLKFWELSFKSKMIEERNTFHLQWKLKEVIFATFTALTYLSYTNIHS